MNNRGAKGKMNLFKVLCTPHRSTIIRERKMFRLEGDHHWSLFCVTLDSTVSENSLKKKKKINHLNKYLILQVLEGVHFTMKCPEFFEINDAFSLTTKL